jgi:purine-binding chemotaxis protein CheW
MGRLTDVRKRAKAMGLLARSSPEIQAEPDPPAAPPAHAPTEAAATAPRGEEPSGHATAAPAEPRGEILGTAFDWSGEERGTPEPPSGFASPLRASGKLPRFGYAEEILRALEERPDASAPLPGTRTAASEPAGESARLRLPGPGLRALGGKYVTFFLGKEEYALPITRVQEIDRVTEITRVPNAPDHLVGVINLRGKILPVIELRMRLGLGPVEADRKNRVVVVDAGTRLLGLLVDAVSQVITIAAERVDEAPEELSASPENCVCGVGKCEDRMVLLLDLDKVLHWTREGATLAHGLSIPLTTPEGGM